MWGRLSLKAADPKSREARLGCSCSSRPWWKLLPSRGKEAGQGHRGMQRAATGISAPGCLGGLAQRSLSERCPSWPSTRLRRLKSHTQICAINYLQMKSTPAQSSCFILGCFLRHPNFSKHPASKESQGKTSACLKKGPQAGKQGMFCWMQFCQAGGVSHSLQIKPWPTSSAVKSDTQQQTFIKATVTLKGTQGDFTALSQPNTLYFLGLVT